MGDSNQENVVATLKAYLKLCSKPENRPRILKDKGILHLLKGFLGDDRVVVITYLVKIMLHMSENPDHALVLGQVGGLQEGLSAASERPFPPNIVYNILVVISRIKTAQDKFARLRDASDTTYLDCVEDRSNNAGSSGPTGRKFVARKSRQLVYEFDELWEDLKNEITRRVLSKKGVISIYFSSNNRTIIRTGQSIDPKEITELLFDCGCEMVTQVVKVDGVDEFFKMYASEREKKVVKLPEYLDDIDVVDPNSCIVPNDYIGERKNAGGWFDTISSFVKSSLW